MFFFRGEARAAPDETDQPAGQERLHALHRRPHRRRGTDGQRYSMQRLSKIKNTSILECHQYLMVP